ncbi:MAG TPA: endonuclease/exonuclease/phosphatase family protein [Schlesneria sp.]|jgi:endonuclease/exonuclease/phosphatase (EEP) superfamily protein YafD
MTAPDQPAQQKPESQPVGPRRWGILEFCTLGLLLATVAGSLGAWYWLLDLCSHFRCYYFGFAVLCLIGVWRRKQSNWKWCLAFVLIWNGGLIAPYLPTSTSETTGQVTPISIVSLNVHTKNQNKKAVVEYLRKQKPDLIVVMEIDVDWAVELKQLDDLYTHRLMNPRPDNFGIGLMSMWPLSRPRVMDFADNDLPSIVATIQHDSSPLQIIATHPLPPIGSSRAAERDQQLSKVALFAKSSTIPCVVAGDFNATPWSAAFREFASLSGLKDSALGRGVQASWNARAWFMRIPIDHVFVPKEAIVVHRAIGPDVGSDHFPVEATIVIPRERE